MRKNLLTPVFILALFVANAFVASANTNTNIIAILTDGNSAPFLLSDVKRIEVTADEYSGTMSILGKDGTLYGDYLKILFVEEVLSVGDLKDIKVKVFPNPVSESLTIQGIDADDELIVYDLGGKCVLQHKGNEINVSDLEQGAYILCVNQQYVKFLKK